MTTTNDLDDKKLRAQIEKTQRELDRMKQMLEDRRLPAEPGGSTVVRFEVTFVTGGLTYNYAAVRVNGRWYTTGTGEPAMFNSWADMLNWIRTETAWHSPIHILVLQKDLAF